MYILPQQNSKDYENLNKITGHSTEISELETEIEDLKNKLNEIIKNEFIIYAQPIGKVNKEDFVKEKSFYEFVEKEGL